MKLRSGIFAGFLLCFFLVQCKTVPLTGRKQLALIPQGQMLSLSFGQYNDVLRDAPRSTNREWTLMVNNSAKRIKTAVTNYMKQNKLGNRLDGFEWQAVLLADQTVNAWAMPGGKIAFYEGIMPICQDEVGVAVVMGHEVAHAIANHGNERMTQGLLQQLGGIGLAVALRDKPAETQALFLGAYGVGTSLGIMLPFSRAHESEADRLGLTFMAMAGYDPREAPRFWQRMAANSQGGSPPEFLSTHPAHNTRIQNLNEYMPEALKYYNKRQQGQ